MYTVNHRVYTVNPPVYTDLCTSNTAQAHQNPALLYSSKRHPHLQHLRVGQYFLAPFDNPPQYYRARLDQIFWQTQQVKVSVKGKLGSRSVSEVNLGQGHFQSSWGQGLIGVKVISKEIRVKGSPKGLLGSRSFPNYGSQGQCKGYWGQGHY